MTPQLGAQIGFDPDPSLTGTFDVSLTRAVVPIRYGVDGSPPGGRIQDIGLGAVVDGSRPARSDVLDLGSAELRIVDLTGPLVVLGWLYPSGLRSLRRAVEDSEDREAVRALTFGMALRALQGAGFGPLTRPTVLRIGFRDLCQDLDLHEDTALRLLLPSGGVVRVHMDYDSVTLIARTAHSAPELELEAALAEAFPGRELLRGPLPELPGTQAYHVPLPIPRSLEDTRGLMKRLRAGLVQLLARCEPDRYRALREVTAPFGDRDSLQHLEDRPDLPKLDRVALRRGSAGGVGAVH